VEPRKYEETAAAVHEIHESHELEPGKKKTYPYIRFRAVLTGRIQPNFCPNWIPNACHLWDVQIAKELVLNTITQISIQLSGDQAATVQVKSAITYQNVNSSSGGV